MRLSKGKIKKLCSNQKQTKKVKRKFKKVKHIKASVKRKNKNINIRNITLKKYDGGANPGKLDNFIKFLN